MNTQEQQVDWQTIGAALCSPFPAEQAVAGRGVGVLARTVSPNVRAIRLS